MLKLSKIYSKLKLLKYLFEKDWEINGQYDAIFFGENGRSLLFNGKKTERIVDSVINDLLTLNLNCISIDNPFSDANLLESWGHVVLINKKFLLALIKEKFFRGQHRLELYRSILRKTNAKIVFTLNARQEICEACHIEKIPCIEVFHGIGYTFIPWGWDKRKVEQLPSHILALDDVSFNTFKVLGEFGVEVRKIEHPFNKRFLIKSYRDKLPDSWITPRHDLKAKKVVLMSLSYGYDNDYEDFKGIINNGIFYDQFLEVFEKTRGIVHWGIRFHQVHMTQKKYQKKFELVKKLCRQFENVEYQWFTNSPLPLVLQHCSANVTMISMSAYDAALFGVRTLALCPNLRNGSKYSNYFEDLVLQGFLEKKEFSVSGVINWVATAERGSTVNWNGDPLWREFISDIIDSEDIESVENSRTNI